MVLEASQDQKIRIESILGTSRRTPNEIDWNGQKDEAFKYARQLGGYVPDNTSCYDCNAKVWDILQESIGIAPQNQEASQDLRSRRLAVCLGDPQTGRERCDRLLGINCLECGCFVHIKATFKRFRCPLNKWPLK